MMDAEQVRRIVRETLIDVTIEEATRMLKEAADRVEIYLEENRSGDFKHGPRYWWINRMQTAQDDVAKAEQALTLLKNKRILRK